MDHVFSKEMQEMIKFYDENYYLAPLPLNSGRKLYIGDKTKRQCRFCGENDPSKFRLEAHAFPELIGNRELISNSECDICNERFSRTIEDHLGKYTLLARAITQIKGKKRPSYKSQSQQSRIDSLNNRIEIIYHPDDNFIELDLDNKRVKIRGYRQPYIPRSVFKCLVKMGISILPDSELPYFTDTIKWLLIENPQNDPVAAAGPFSTICSFTPGPKPFPFIMATLLKRKVDTADLPYTIFFIAFSNFTFQIALPFSNKDCHLIGKQLTLPAFPNIYHDGTAAGMVRYSAVNFALNDYVRNESDHIFIHFNSITETQL